MNFLQRVESICESREGRRAGRRAYDAFRAAYRSLQGELGTVPPEVVLPLLKVCRLACTPDDQDSWDDLAGYAKLGAESWDGEEAS